VPCRDCCRITTNLWREPSRRCGRRPGYVTTMAGGVGPGGRKWDHRHRPKCRPAVFHSNSRVFRACCRVDRSSVVYLRPAGGVLCRIAERALVKVGCASPANVEHDHPNCAADGGNLPGCPRSTPQMLIIPQLASYYRWRPPPQWATFAVSNSSEICHIDKHQVVLVFFTMTPVET
jgi:hypothetical protein